MKKLILIAGLIFAPSLFALDGLTLSWQDNSDNEDGFNVEASRDGGEFVVVGSVTQDETEFVHTIPDEDRSALFAYRVNAFNAFGNSGYTNTVEARRMDYESPNAPTNPIIRVPSITINVESLTINPSNNAES